MAKTFYSIVGPTGSGKTGVAIALAEDLLASGRYERVAIASADSRQVYKGLEVVTGADLPAKHHLQLQFFGIGVVSPFEDWSAAHFVELLRGVLEKYSGEKDLVLVVGGTMLYQQSIDRAELGAMPGPDEEVRQRAALMNLGELQSWLTSINESALTNMNDSDKSNPRRLVRAIERTVSPVVDVSPTLPDWEHKWFGLMPEKEMLVKNITQRVAERFDNGARDEAIALRAQIEGRGFNPRKIAAWTSCGLPFLDAFNQGEIDKKKCLELWTQAEVQYVKRQLTWWKKQTNITWFAKKADLLNKLLQL